MTDRARSADRALVVAEHERRLDHVGQSRHLRQAAALLGSAEVTRD